MNIVPVSVLSDLARSISVPVNFVGASSAAKEHALVSHALQDPPVPRDGM
jgi:hypothetical protein